MTFFILAEEQTHGEALSAQLAVLAPDCLCFVMTDLQELASALLEVQVDRVILSRSFAEHFSWSEDAKPPYVLFWPEEMDAWTLAKRLLEQTM